MQDFVSINKSGLPRIPSSVDGTVAESLSGDSTCTTSFFFVVGVARVSFSANRMQDPATDRPFLPLLEACMLVSDDTVRCLLGVVFGDNNGIAETR